jgi:hypothetical protein
MTRMDEGKKFVEVNYMRMDVQVSCALYFEFYTFASEKTSPLILFVRFFKLAKIFPRWVFKFKNYLIKKKFLFLLLKTTPEG